MRTINGQSVADVFKLLQADFPRQDIRRHKYTRRLYIPVDIIKNRLDSVVGIGNWEFVATSKPELWKLGSNSYESCVLSGKLVIYDDDRLPIERCAGGGADIIYPKDDDRPKSIANSVDSAYQDVFKRCAKRFGIAKLDQEGGQDSEAPPVDPNPVLMEVAVLDVFRALGRGGAKVKVRYQEESLELMIWSRQWNELQKTYSDTFQVGIKLNSIKFMGKACLYRGKKQLEFCRLAPVSKSAE